MKRVGNLYNKITDINVIMNVYEDMKKNVKNKRKIAKFEEYYTYNIITTQNILVSKKYKFIKYNIFLIKEPKYRIVMSQNIGDKLINHLVARFFLVNILDKSLINMNVATRINKGTLFGIKALKQYLVKLINKGNDIYALKFDIHKYFYSIDHEILLDLLKRKIKDKDVIDILTNIISSTNYDYVNRNITNIKNKEIELINQLNISEKEKRIKLKQVESIPLYEKGKGLPIGNMTSQILAIFYLNELDHFIKEKLKCEYYIRYMDDGIILSESKEELNNFLIEIKKIICSYKLELNDKTIITNVRTNGIDFLGFRLYVKNKKIIMKVRNNTKKRFKKKMKMKNLEIVNSYKSHFKHGNCYNLFKKYAG